MKIFYMFAAALCLAASSLNAIDFSDFSRYQVILDKMPFGEPPPVVKPPDNVGPPPIPANDFSKFLKLCAIRVDDRGMRVGFLDTKAKPPTSYYVRVGAPPENGFEVLDADYEDEKALIRKDGLERWITMSGALIADSEPAAAAAAPKPGTRTSSSSRAEVSSYAERLKRRREALRHREVKPPQLQGEALKKHLESYQMDLIRKGQPPLPMQLTPEMDEQLVKEGVLPPIE